DSMLPGWSDNSYIKATGGGQLQTDNGHPGAFVARGRTTGAFPAVVRLAFLRTIGAQQIIVPAESATWVLFTPKAQFAVAFANGRPLAAARMCVGGSLLAPTA